MLVMLDAVAVGLVMLGAMADDVAVVGDTGCSDSGWL